MMRAVIFLLATGLVLASGTFFRPPPPPRKAVLDPATIEKGRVLFEKQIKGSSCASCHQSGAEHAFRRRSLSRSLKNLAREALKCQTDEQRMGLSQPWLPTAEDLEPVRKFLASKHRLEDYL